MLSTPFYEASELSSTQFPESRKDTCQNLLSIYRCWSASGNPQTIIFYYLYIKEYRTALSTRQSLIGSSWDFTCEQGRSRAWKQWRSDVDCTLLINVTRENSSRLIPGQASSSSSSSSRPTPHGLLRYTGHWPASGVQHSTALLQP